MKRLIPNQSTILFFIIFIFLIFSFISYKLLLKNLSDNHIKNQEIVFYKIQKKTSDLLTKLLFRYSQEKEFLLNKHKEVLTYLENKSYDINLDEIYEKINKNSPNKPYNIYITDEKLIIKNTTYLADLDFDLSFAKEVFEEHKNKKTIGTSLPIFEIYSSKFFSYTDSYLNNTKRILQVSFTYEELNKDLKELENLINQELDIKTSNAFIVYDDGFVGDFIFKISESEKQTLEEIKDRINKGKKLSKELDENKYITDSFINNSDLKKYKISYLSEKSPIFNEAKIIYSIIFDEKEYKNKIYQLNFIMILISIIGVITIYTIFKIRYKEKLLNYKDKFIEHSVHEIKTPLSIISLNIQLRNKNFGIDKYSKKIEGALKTLENSYEDMTFLHTKEKIDYRIEKINISRILENRIKYFETIAQTQNRILELKIYNDLFFNISTIELHRLIDNNLSNAIKYSNIGSSIQIILKDDLLEFHSIGENIKDVKNIFEKYSRQNNSVGGHGLGLSIVNDICKKYNIKIEVTSKNNLNIFSYKFNCHNVDTREV